MTKEQRKWQAMRTTQGKLDFSKRKPTRINPVPDLDSYRFDYSTVTTELFETLAKKSEIGEVTVRLNLHPFTALAATGTWKVSACVITNNYAGTHPDRITATALKHESGRQFDKFSEFVERQLDSIDETWEMNKLVYATFDPPYRIHVRSTTFILHSKAGTTSELAIAGVIVMKTGNGLLGDIFK